MSIEEKIQYINRESGEFETEKVYGSGFLRWLYCSPSGKYMAPFLCRKFISRLYGFFQDLSWSVRKIRPFINEFQIKVDDFLLRGDEEEIRKSYASFNEFFIRKFRPDKRTFVPQEDLFPAFVEGRFLCYEKWNEAITYPVKGKYLNPLEILGDKRVADEFAGGPLIIGRLCPTDYHRFHFPDKGQVMGTYRIAGLNHSVSPMALKFKEDIFCTNERQITLLSTENFGKLAYVEVGAFCVGKIIQTYKKPDAFVRGDEKGYFLFGGSTVIIFGQKNAFLPDKDLLENTLAGNETWVKLGTRIGKNVFPRGN